MIDLATFDLLGAAEAESTLLACCASPRWAATVAARRPFPDLDALLAAADDVWWSLDGSEWLAAFAAHPRIGERPPGHGTAARWSTGEQSRAAASPPEVQAAIAEGNRRYEERFGHVFLIAAAGRTGEEILAELERRLGNEPASELREAAGEQAKIMRMRVERMFGRG